MVLSSDVGSLHLCNVLGDESGIQLVPLGQNMVVLCVCLVGYRTVHRTLRVEAGACTPQRHGGWRLWSDRKEEEAWQAARGEEPGCDLLLCGRRRNHVHRNLQARPRTALLQARARLRPRTDSRGLHLGAATVSSLPFVG